MINKIFNFQFSIFKSTRRGFTLLLAVLISSILIALGGAIFNIISKQIALSSAGRESQFAFFAADSGVECALYWDRRQDAFSITSPLTQVLCGGDTPVDSPPSHGTLTRTYDPNPPDAPGRPRLVTTFSFSFNGVVTNPCVDVRVTKNSLPTNTLVESYGHNTCVLTNPLRLECAIRVNY